MASVLHLRKELVRPPVAAPVPEAVLRTIRLPGDISQWLALRERAMAHQVPGVRLWSEADFLAEMVNKPWWRSDRTWVALAGELRLAGLASRGVSAPGPARRSSPASGCRISNPIIGAVTLAMREGQVATVPVIHWLLVDPVWRRRGIGRMLLAHLEKAVWDARWREVQLETHSGWSSAVAFYHSMGYAEVRERSPR